MSRSGRMKFLTEEVKAEREVLIKLLRAYKENGCLWNTCHPDYNNKLRKNIAQEKLVKIYKAIDPNADMTEVRKKLDHMRSSGKRYFKKKLEAKTKGHRYSCSLWYYNRIKFVYGDDEDDDTDMEDDHISLSDEEESKLTDDRRDKIKYASEDNELLNSVDSPSGLSNNSKEQKGIFSITEEACLFGTAIDRRLSEVDPEQEDLAKNLILRVVYLARMNKLTPDTDISLKSSD